MIDFDSIFDDDDDPASPEDLRRDRLARDDREIFEGKRLHEVKATMSMSRAGRRDSDSQTFRATRAGPNGQEEAIGLTFRGQRLDDLKSGALLAEMEKERRAELAKGKDIDPSREVDLTGAWKMRRWKDAAGKEHKAFDLLVASWTFTSKTGERVTEGAAPSVKMATREDERSAAVRAKAADRAQARSARPARSDGAVEI